jgi:REP element-mobilizing transposase RayT
MARRPRADTPGSWHHVLNRAIAKRPYYEARSDKRYFLARLASEVRAGRLEVHAYSLMTTHFHLLVRSPIGELSEGMRRLQLAYSRHFNRRRHRDGPLIRSRFYSKRVNSEAYRRAVVRYIDANAVAARVVDRAAEHEFGSARAFLVGPRPPWLSSDWIERCAQEHSEAASFDAKAYLSTFGPREGEDLESLRDLIEMRMSSARDLDPLDDLIGRTPDQVRQWMIRKARLADGEEIGLPVCGPQAVRRSILAQLEGHGEWLVDHGTRTWKGSRLAWPGLLRDLCSMPFSQIAGLCRASVWAATRQVDLHHASIAEDATYAATVAEIAGAALGVTFPDRPSGTGRG